VTDSQDSRPTTIAGLYEWTAHELDALDARIEAAPATTTTPEALLKRLELVERAVFGTDHAGELEALTESTADAVSRRLVDD
jgi:hypothetical protein